MTVQDARSALTEAIRPHGVWEMPEANNEINDASRGIVAAMSAEHGEAWLVKTNPWNGDRKVVWKAECGCGNFEADYVMPAYDAEIERMILERVDTPYTGTAGDRPMVIDITNRIEQVGGVLLIWT